MNWLIVIPVVLVIISLPIAWLISEFKTKKILIRCIFGILSILCCFAVSWLTTQLIRFNYNAWYGSSSKMLIDAAVEKLEAGDTQKVLKELKSLQEVYQPTYENKANYDELTKKSAQKILSKN